MLPVALYEGVLALARLGARLASPFHERLRRALRGRVVASRRFASWASESRDPSRPLVWVHAPSVGEALMAQAVIRELRAVRPDVQVAFTHFSPSAERMVAEVDADVRGYLPWDTRGGVRPALEALRPAAVVFVRTEVWPVLAREAERYGAKLLLVNAVLSADSSRLRGLARRFLEPTFGRLAQVGAVTAEHGARYGLLGVPADRIHVTGDARFDQVLARVEEQGLDRLRAGRGDPPEVLRGVWPLLSEPGVFTVVAGSTWPADEAVLVPPVASLRRDRRVCLVVAPHEPTTEHLEGLELRLDRHALRHARFSALAAAGARPDGGAGTSPEVVVVDRMGVLADLYAAAQVAYVGGGFGVAGLHSVVEPAALGVPVLYGPTHGNAREAGELAVRGGGFVVRSAGEVEARLHAFADHPESARTAGELARSYVREGAGAAARNAALIAGCLDLAVAPVRHADEPQG